jgi:hypothetical protein
MTWNCRGRDRRQKTDLFKLIHYKKRRERGILKEKGEWI